MNASISPVPDRACTGATGNKLLSLACKAVSNLLSGISSFISFPLNTGQVLSSFWVFVHAVSLSPVIEIPSCL